VRTAAKVCVLGQTVNTQLFGQDHDPVGEIIRVRNQPCRVVGVLAPKGANGIDGDMDDQILVPYTTVMKRLLGQQNITAMTMAAWTAESVRETAEQVAVLLRQRHRILPGRDDDFTVRTIDEMVEMRTATMGTMTTLLSGIAGVSLVVGGIGIMNIMLVSVTERTREIGLRMAIGAKGRDVLLQFLVEAVALSLTGGAIGIAIGFGLSSMMESWMGWPADVPPRAIAMSFGFATAVGLFFGFYPALRAAQLAPIEALRSE
jgi:putative ABC transport system permease protein